MYGWAAFTAGIVATVTPGIFVSLGLFFFHINVQSHILNTVQ